MPQLISLDDSSYEEIYEKAMETLHAQAPWWTHTEVSDPGIMLLEMWALLSDMQSFYLDQVQESHYRKYLKLLGIRPDEGECARTWVFFDNVARECTVPEGTKLLADQMVFETVEEAQLIRNRLIGFSLGDGLERIGAMMLQRKSSFALQEGKGPLFSFTLEEPLRPERSFFFFILLQEEKGRSLAENGFYMAQLAWEYRTGKGWREAQVVRDDTRGLLFSGLTGIRTDTPMEGDGQRGYEIRCRIKKGAYDVTPVLYKIYLNVVEVIQKNTLCCAEEVDFSEKCHKAALKSYLARTGRLWILQRKDRGMALKEGELWEDITDSPYVRVDPPVTAERMERHIFFAGEGRVRIVCSAEQTASEELVREVTGVAAQQIPLPWERLLRPSVNLLLRHGGGEKQYATYRMAEPEEDRYSNVWHWKEEENVIVLGDGRHGEIPPPSKEGLRFTSLALWEGEKGNVSIDRITAWEKPELFPGITCMNRLTGRGGRERRPPSQQFMEAGERFLEQNRMVTEADIQNLAKGIPGLLIKDVKAQWRDNVLVVRIVPKYGLKSSYCVQRYQSQAEKYLEQYRLAGTVLKVEVKNE